MLTAERFSCYRLDLVDGLSCCGWEAELVAEAPRDEIAGCPGIKEGMYWNRDI